jgi:hypothetical protein
MSVKTFDPNQVTVIAGDNIISGFADDVFINVTRVDELYDVSRDVHGKETIRIKKNNNDVTITFLLSQSSESNSVFSDFLIAGRFGLPDKFKLLIVDNNNEKTLFKAQEAWVQNPAPGTIANTFQNRSWTIMASNLDYSIGGVIG